MPIDNEILKDFTDESKTLIAKMNSILEKCEGDMSQVKGLEEYALNMDRIMGAAKTLALSVSDSNHLIHKIGIYSALCKMVGSKASRIKFNQQFYDICVALLADGTEVMQAMIEGLPEGKSEIRDLFSQTFLDRLKWVSTQFRAEIRTADLNNGQSSKLNQNEIDNLIKKLGLD